MTAKIFSEKANVSAHFDIINGVPYMYVYSVNDDRSEYVEITRETVQELKDWAEYVLNGGK